MTVEGLNISKTEEKSQKTNCSSYIFDVKQEKIKHRIYGNILFVIDTEEFNFLFFFFKESGNYMKDNVVKLKHRFIVYIVNVTFYRGILYRY